MRYAFETIAAQATAPGAGANAAAVAGDSLRIRDCSRARLIDVIPQFQTAAVANNVRITSPLLHDSTVGINVRGIQDQKSGIKWPVMQELTPQDTLTVNIAGSAVAGDIEQVAMSILYEDLAGIDVKFVTAAELRSRFVEMFAPRALIVVGAGTAGGWQGSTALTATDDQWKANDEYAWLGVSMSTLTVDAGALAMVSPDFGNLRIACPLNGVDQHLTSAYFYDMADRYNLPLIPVINASQKSNIFLTTLNNEVAQTSDVSLYMARLKPKGGR